MRTFALACVLLGAACGSNHGSGGDDANVGDGNGSALCTAGLTSIDLAPATSTVELDGGTPPTVTFTATGHFSDGHTESLDVGALTWTATRADATDPGTVVAGVFTPFPSAGGVVTITASAASGATPCATGTATVTLHLTAIVGTTPNPGDWSGTPVTTGAPTIVYPSDQTRFPRNLYRTLFQWRSAGYNEFRLTFTGTGSTVTVYSDGADPQCATAAPPAGCWQVDESTWSFIAASNAGSTATWTVDALDRSTVPPTVRRAGPITIGFSKRDVKGAVFYWSTTAAGVRRANITAQYPEDYIAAGTTYTSPTDKVQCVACHVVSRDGQYLAAPVQASSGQSLWITQVTDVAPPTPLVKQIANTGGHGFATISPDDAYVVASWGGLLWMVDRATGAYLAPITITGMGTQPDWSPAGDLLAFATAKGDAPAGASIATLHYAGGTTWDTQTVVAAHDPNLSNLFPAFSPSGDHIAYVKGKGGHDDVTAQLMVIPSTGGTPVELINANRVVNNATTTGQFENSQPTWGPDGDYEWIAFNSKRAYGVVAAAGMQQIWVAAIDPAALAAGTADPSFPAFRLQFQGLGENNHRAYWTKDIRDNPPPPPPADAGVCVPHGGTCVPGVDCCLTPGDVCDTTDNGVTYTCLTPTLPGFR